MRSGQLFTDAIGLGNVGHRGHPAELLAVFGQQRRKIHACVEQRAVAPYDLQLEATGRRLAGQHDCKLGQIFFTPLAWPVRKRGRLSNQLLDRPARHLNERLVDVPQHAIAVNHAHAGRERIFHRAAKRRLSAQHTFHLGLLDVAPSERSQRGHHDQRQTDDQP